MLVVCPPGKKAVRKFNREVSGIIGHIIANTAARDSFT